MKLTRSLRRAARRRPVRFARRLCLETLEDRTAPPAASACSRRARACGRCGHRFAGHPRRRRVPVQPRQRPRGRDWNGDGIEDIGVFNRDTATWYLRYGETAGTPNAGVFVFGPAGGTPVVGDWNGDGRSDIGVYVGGSGTWYLRLGASGGRRRAPFSRDPENSASD